MLLPDGTVIPSYFGVQSIGENTFADMFEKPLLQQGEVKALVYPDDPRNISRRYLEYLVDVQESSGRGGGGNATYICTVANHFGGAADRFQYTLRADDKSARDADGLGTGSKVLIQCINGYSGQGVIVSGIRDSKLDNTTVDKKDDGHNLYWEFNGASFSVNDAGEMRLQFRGKTRADGRLGVGVSTEAQPTAIDFLRNGDWQVSTRDQVQYLRLSHDQKKVEFLADKEFNLRVSDGKVVVKSKGVEIGDATEKFPMFSTYRDAEVRLHRSLVQNLGRASTQISAAAASIMSASTLHPAFTTAGQALLQAASALTGAVSALTQFEGKAQAYVSARNKSD